MKPTAKPMEIEVEKDSMEIPTLVTETITTEDETTIKKGVSKKINKLLFTSTRLMIREVSTPGSPASKKETNFRICAKVEEVKAYSY